MSQDPGAGAAHERDAPGRRASFPIVGIGASAGGLEAFTQLLAALPLDTGMGFVLVQHLDPDHESALTQILSRATSLPVREITDDQPVEPNHVYVIPRDTDLTIAEGVLKLQPRARTRTPHRPIDTSSSRWRRTSASGPWAWCCPARRATARWGWRRSRPRAGSPSRRMTRPSTTRCPAAPWRRAASISCFRRQDIAKELARIAKHPYVAGQRSASRSKARPARRIRASATAHEHDGTPLRSGGRGHPGGGENAAPGPSATAGRWASPQPARARGRLQENPACSCATIPASTSRSTSPPQSSGASPAAWCSTSRTRWTDYASFLRGNAKELDALYSDVLISVTSFFRNPETFDVLQREGRARAPRAARRRADRCWVLGCSTGQEAYSIAIAFAEAAEKAPRDAQDPDLRHRSQRRTAREGPPRSVCQEPRRRTSRPNACGGSSSRRKAATASARRCAKWWSSRGRT